MGTTTSRQHTHTHTHTNSMGSRTAVSLLRRRSPSATSFAPFRSVNAAKASSSVISSGPSFSGLVSVAQTTRSFSDDSHGDFAAKKTTISDGVDDAVDMIQQHVTANPVMLYMKGNPSQPMCGFSAKMVQTLQAEGIDFSSVNVLEYPSIREGVKKFAAWPTIPQLYVNGEFIGGIDIVSEMHESGELKALVAESKAD